MFRNQKSKNKLIKKSSQRHLQSRNDYAFTTSQELVNLFIISLLNNTNQLIKNDENEKSETERSNTTILFFKIFIFFQKFKQAKNRFNIKIDKENFIFFHFYNRKFFEKNSSQIVFVNKKKSLIKIKINS